MRLHLRSPQSGLNHWLSRSLLYEDVYVWLFLASALDVVLTWSVLTLGGQRVNVIGSFIMESLGAQGLTLYRACVFLGMVLLCEEVGRRRPMTGRRLAQGLTAFCWLPVLIGVVLLLRAL